jgi:superfamily I DNA and/or RNA helicase
MTLLFLTDVPLVMLTKQYRMHPEISKFPNAEFYEKRLEDGTVDATGQPVANLSPPISSLLPLNPSSGKYPSAIFLDHLGREARRGRSIENAHEAELVCYVIEDLLLKNPVGSSDSAFNALTYIQV